MKRITYRQTDYRARFTKEGNQMYCSTQATTDTIAKYEELLEQLGYVFDDNSAEVNESKEIYSMRQQKNDNDRCATINYQY